MACVSFLRDFTPRTVHNPYATGAQPSHVFLQPRELVDLTATNLRSVSEDSTSTASSNNSSLASVPPYHRALLSFEQIPYASDGSSHSLLHGRSVMTGKHCARELAHCIRVKLGGVCGDCHPLVIANLVLEVTGVCPAGVDMFTRNMGRCSLWLTSFAEVVTVQERLANAVWMGPVEVGYAVRCRNAASARYLEDCVAHSAADEHHALRYPRHLMTVELWQDAPQTDAPHRRHYHSGQQHRHARH